MNTLVKSTIPDSLQQRIPSDILEKLQFEMASLEGKLLAQDPEMKGHLAATHRLLISYPESVHLLDDSGVALLIQAAQKHMQVSIVSEVAKGKGKAKAKPSVEDL